MKMNELSPGRAEMDTVEVREVEITHLELRYAHTRIIKRESLVSLAASLEQWGQIIPVITTSPCVLIDGYRRVAALKLCKRDTVVAEHWNLKEDQAVLRVLSVGCHRRWDAVEEAALIRELTCSHKMSQAQIARRLGRNPSWVARRLSLLEALPEEILERVRSGYLSSWAASRVLAPLARANADHAAAIGVWVEKERVSTRDLVDFFAHYKSAGAITRERMTAEPSLFLKTLRTRREDKQAERLRAGPEGRWLSDLLGVVATLRHLKHKASAILYPDHKDRDCVLAALGEASGFIRTLDHEIRRINDSKGIETGCPNPSPEGDGNSPDQPRPEGVEEHHPQGSAR